jgi:hypothetical protein
MILLGGIYTESNFVFRARTPSRTRLFYIDYEYEYENRPSKTGLSTTSSLEANRPIERYL